MRDGVTQRRDGTLCEKHRSPLDALAGLDTEVGHDDSRILGVEGLAHQFIAVEGAQLRAAPARGPSPAVRLLLAGYHRSSAH